MKKWRYIYYDDTKGVVTSGNQWKEPFLWSSDSPGTDYLDVTTQSELVGRELEIMTLREESGKAAYFETQAELRLSRIASGASHAIFNQYVYAVLKPVIDSVWKGSWLDAYDFLNNTSTTIADGQGGTIPNPVFNNEMKVSFRIKIATFLTTSNLYDEFTGKEIDSEGFILQ